MWLGKPCSLMLSSKVVLGLLRQKPSAGGPEKGAFSQKAVSQQGSPRSQDTEEVEEVEDDSGDTCDPGKYLANLIQWSVKPWLTHAILWRI